MNTKQRRGIILTAVFVFAFARIMLPVCFSDPRDRGDLPYAAAFFVLLALLLLTHFLIRNKILHSSVPALKL